MLTDGRPDDRPENRMPSPPIVGGIIKLLLFIDVSRGTTGVDETYAFNGVDDVAAWRPDVESH